jgi:hypothetical protein
MDKISNIRWLDILTQEAAYVEENYKVCIEIDEAVVLEAERLINDHLSATGLIQPNVAKIAGLVAFWIRKLKPLHITFNSSNRLSTVNELVGLRIGLALCNLYVDDNSKDHEVKLHPRIFNDWVTSFRYHSHSPSSSINSFELLMCDV